MVSLPFIQVQRTVRGTALALSLGLLPACSPHINHSLPASSAVRESHDNPARDAHLNLLREAHRAFVQERYSAAVLFFRRFVEVAERGAPRMAEAHWWLGRSYEQLGDFRAAMAEYRTLAVDEPAADSHQHLYHAHALRRLEELRQTPAATQALPARQITVGVSLGQVPPVSDWVPWFQSLLKSGVTALLIDPALPDGAAGEDLNQVRVLVGAAHLAGLAVWVSLDLHQGRGLPVRADWMSVAVGKGSSGLRESIGDLSQTIHVDVTHPAYQAAVAERAKALLQTGCDGILLQAREGEGFAKEYSEESFRLFVTAFGLTVSPHQLLGEGEGGAAPVPEQDAPYWRWVGWKARTYVALASRIRTNIRESSPTAQLLIEVHQTTVDRPVAGLEQYGEDLVELRQRTGGTLVVRREGPRPVASREWLAQQTGVADGLWIGVRVSGSEFSSVAEWVGAAMAMVPEEGTWNLLARLPEAARFP